MCHSVCLRIATAQHRKAAIGFCSKTKQKTDGNPWKHDGFPRFFRPFFGPATRPKRSDAPRDPWRAPRSSGLHGVGPPLGPHEGDQKPGASDQKVGRCWKWELYMTIPIKSNILLIVVEYQFQMFDDFDLIES